MTKGVGLRELEKRLKDEPDNLGLRVTVAGALHEAGRKADAVELYRSVAIAYRDQGRTQQAIAVCRSILEIAPEDSRCTELLASLLPRAEGSQAVKSAVIPTPVPRPPALTPATPALRPAALTPAVPVRTVPRPEGSQSGPVRRSSMDETPLPGPLPYHVADPTTRSLKKLSEIDLPTSEGADTRPGSSGTPPPMDGLANAARRISAELIRAGESYDSLDVSEELDTRQRKKIETGELQKISRPPPAVAPPPVQSFDDEGPTTPPPAERQESDDGVVHDTEEELTVPREIPGIDVISPRARSSGEVTKLREPADPRAAMLAAPFFAPLPPPRRAAILGRFHAKTVRAGAGVIRQGESDAALVIVGSGRLEVRLERAGKQVLVESVGAGDYIGEGALLSRTPAAAHVIAATDAELLLLLPHDFYEIAGQYPALWALLKDVAERRARDLAKLR